MVTTFTNSAESLSYCAKLLFKKYPKNTSYRFLASKVGMSPSTFQRILNKETARPSFKNAMKIVRAVCGDGDIQKFVEKYYPEMHRHLPRIYPDNHKVPFAPSETEDFFRCPNTYKIMLMALGIPDLTREEIILKLGSSASVALDRLISENVIQTDGDRICIKDSSVNLAQSAIHALFQNLLNQSYNLAKFGTTENWLSVQTEGVDSKRANIAIKEILVETRKKIREVLQSPDFKGRDIIWIGLAMDNLLPPQERDESIDVTNNPSGGTVQ